MLAVMAVIAVAATAVVGMVHGGTTKSIRAKGDDLFIINRQETSNSCDKDDMCACDPPPECCAAKTDDPCACEPHLKLEQTIHSNLGKKAKPGEPEGMVFPGTYTDPKTGTNRKVLLVMNASEPWTGIDTHPCCNGLDKKGGVYGMVTARADTFIHVTFSLKDAETRDPVILRELDITFFDLDKHSEDGEIEYVKLFDEAGDILASGTKVTKTENTTEKSYTYTATQIAGPENNPQNPLLLTVEQKQCAVTVKYTDTDHFVAELGSIGRGKQNYRGFIFDFRPTLRCARVDGDDPGIVVTEKKTTTSEPTTTAAAATTTTTTGKNCLFIVPMFGWCFPKFW